MEFLKKQICIITGEIGVGKTYFLSSLLPEIKKHWQVDGFICLPEGERTRGQNSSHYKLKFVNSSQLFSWAKRKQQKRGYLLNSTTQQLVTNRLLHTNAEIVILDDLGPYELKGEGFANIFTALTQRDDLALIIVVKKRVLENFIQHFSLASPTIIDLDRVSIKQAKKIIFKMLYQLDSERVGLYASIAGLSEITIGSFLHSIHIPLKGHILTLLQSFMLIQFAKELRGRNLILISTIAAGIKSFSPAGAKLKPMFYIFTQGILFSLPISLIGVNLLSVTLGAILLGVTTIFISLGLNYIIYGNAYLISFNNILQILLHYLNLNHLSLWQAIIILAIVKTLITILLAIPAYYFDFSHLIEKMKYKVIQNNPNTSSKKLDLPTNGWKEAMLGGITDLTLKQFTIPFILMALIIYFFSHLNFEQLTFTLIRALLVSWFGFTITRRINFIAIIKLLRKKGLNNWADGIELSLKTIQHFKKQ